ncbi:MAG TPA: hypothetical protein DC058_14690 [Planctomycetaceae bacterium]|nr:hypothetical protein [Planctomycetaceae bacterium]HBC62446.1 hypothetical protein [Planctomycetaceae bacterium]
MIRTFTFHRQNISENGVEPRVHMPAASEFRFVQIVATASVSLILCSGPAEVLDLHNPPRRNYVRCCNFCNMTGI